MAKLSTYYKLFNLKEQEKNKTCKIYEDSVKQFEQVATRMYEFLKKKEQAEIEYEKQLRSSIAIKNLHVNYEYIASLENGISKLQRRVQEARTNMENNLELLTEAHIEMKKYEKLIKNRKVKEKELEQEMENKQMDEISVQQFLNQGK